MSMKPNAAKARHCTPTDEKAPSAGGAGGYKTEASNCSFDFAAQLKALQGKRITTALVADLRLLPCQTIRRQITNPDALAAVALAEALAARYIVIGGNLMAVSGGAIAANILDAPGASSRLLQAVTMVNSRLAELSDCTAWLHSLTEQDKSMVMAALCIRETLIYSPPAPCAGSLSAAGCGTIPGTAWGQ